MKTGAFITLAAALCLSAGAGAATYTSPSGTVQAGTSYFSLPAMANPADTPTVFAGIPITGKLFYWCRQTQEWFVYPTDWGLPTIAVPWHMGLRLDADQAYTISFTGGQPTSERSTCLNPLVAGYACISQPYNWEGAWTAFRFSSDKIPGVKYSTAQAVALGWIEDYMIEGAQDSGVHITLDGAGGTSTTVKPWKAYWVQTRIDPSVGKITIYWPTAAVPEPSCLLALGAGLASLAGGALGRRKL